MTEVDHRKALLLAKIDAHRAVLGLELRCARATMNPLDGLLGHFGIDHALTGVFTAGMRLVSADGADSSRAWTDLVPLVVAAVLRLLARRAESEPDGEAAASS
jgi:hypothetical protein